MDSYGWLTSNQLSIGNTAIAQVPPITLIFAKGYNKIPKPLQ
jgi:hypothetical protein